MSRIIIALALVATPLLGCQGLPSEETPIVPIRNMYNQPRYDPQEKSVFFADERTMRPPVEGTVAREMVADIPTNTGRSADDTEWLATVPNEALGRLGGMDDALERGHERYDIYCAVCHGLQGDGCGMVSQRAASLGFSGIVAPTLQDERIRTMPDGQLYATITNGIRNMPAYSQSVPLEDRWAITSYVRALQLSWASRPADQQVPSCAEEGN